jgi:transcriptional regulator with PAS, ATPase and Fis domain
MTQHSWIKEFPAAVLVCDVEGTIIEMNAQAAKDFETDGGEKLLGKNLLDCHPEPARSKLRDIVAYQKTNVYTIERAGVKKLIYQAPWTIDGRYAGLVEISFEIPAKIRHFPR